MPLTAAELDIVLKARDDASRTMQGFGRNLDSVGQSAGGATKALNIMKGVVGALGLAMLARTGVRAFTNYVKGAVDSAKEFQLVTAQLESVLKSTGGVAGITAQDVRKLANEMQRTTMFSDDAVISAQNLLLTFTQIGKDVFPDAMRIIADVSQAMGQDLSQTAIQVGKALNDPILGLTALQRVGIQFSDAQKEVIKQMVETGNVVGAQREILKELETQFGGSAVAAGQTFAGQMTILRNRMEDVKKEIGLSLLPILQEIVKRLSGPFVKTLENAGQALVAMIDDVKIFVDAWATTKEGFEEGIDVKPIEEFGLAVLQIAKSFELLALNVKHSIALIKLYLDDLKTTAQSVVAFLDDLWERHGLAYDEPMSALEKYERQMAGLELKYRPGRGGFFPEVPEGLVGQVEALTKAHKADVVALENRYDTIEKTYKLIKTESAFLSRIGPEGPWRHGMGMPASSAMAEVENSIENVTTTLATAPDTSAWDSAFSTLTSRIKGYFDSAIGHSKRLFDGVGDWLAPGADGPFENIYRAMAVAVHGDPHWAEVLGLTQEEAQKVMHDWQRGLMSPEVLALIDIDQIVEFVNMEQMAEASLASLVGIIAQKAGVGAPAVRAILGVDSPAVPGVIKSDIASLSPTITDALESLGPVVQPGAEKLGGTIGKGMIKGVMDEATAFAKAIEKMIQDAYEAGKRAAEAFSPSRRFARLGEDIAAGLTHGLSEGMASVERAMSSMVAPPMLPAFATTGTSDARRYNINVYTHSRDDILDTMGGIGLR